MFLALLGTLLAAALPARAVVDCSRPLSNVDRMICTSERAAAAERRMARSFRSAFARAADREQLLSEQARWKQDVLDPCVEVQCVVSAFDARVEELDDRP